MQTEHLIALCRIVGVLLVTDGQLTDEEYEYFYGLMDRFELSDADRASVTSAISVDTDLSADVEVLREGGHGQALLETLRAAASVDGQSSRVEEHLMGRISALLSPSP